MRSLEELTRPNIRDLQPYSCARNEYSGKANVYLDANECPYNAPLNRYPDPLQTELKKKISTIKGVPEANIFLGNGSDEAIDLVYRCFASPGIDNVVAIEPTYGMYKVCADINNVEYRPVLLDDRFQMSAYKILAACDNDTKVIWICSPNNPTGNSMNHKEIETVLYNFDGLVVVDEAYSDFSREKPMHREIGHYRNLIVLNTFSKAWGCAAIRLGMAFASKEIIDIFNKVKYPYNVNLLTQEKAIAMLNDRFEVDRTINLVLQEREKLIDAFRMLPACKFVYPTDANFFLAKMTNATAIYNYLKSKGIIVRNRSNVALCDNCLRITVGTKRENNELLAALRQM